MSVLSANKLPTPVQVCPRQSAEMPIETQGQQHPRMGVIWHRGLAVRQPTLRQRLRTAALPAAGHATTACSCLLALLLLLAAAAVVGGDLEAGSHTVVELTPRCDLRCCTATCADTEASASAATLLNDKSER
jgi:hypothetical protein